MGYSKDFKDASDKSEYLWETSIEAIRREAEKADFFMGSIIFHSLAGGTGSGLGSRIIEEYRNYFGKSYLGTVSVWPSQNGDTPLQHYNSCFSLASIQEHADFSLNF